MFIPSPSFINFMANVLSICLFQTLQLLDSQFEYHIEQKSSRDLELLSSEAKCLHWLAGAEGIFDQLRLHFWTL